LKRIQSNDGARDGVQRAEKKTAVISKRDATSQTQKKKKKIEKKTNHASSSCKCTSASGKINARIKYNPSLTSNL
jgi:hypothetical protein